jgi:prolipoprotein diacylglyceryl transferase
VTAAAAGAVLHAVIPSPTQGVWYLGPFPLRAYALCIIAGIILAVRMGEKRYAARGGEEGVVLDIAAWAVPFGIIGGRIYHVVTTPGPYFGEGGRPVTALYIWQGGLGIWGAVALGALGAYIGARRRGVYLPPLADALAPGVLAAQALGRWGNYFNNELYGRPTDLPWALKIYEWDQSAGRAVLDDAGAPKVNPDGPFHPTFLYESLWSAAGVVLLLWVDRRFRLGHGRLFALYIAVYTSGRLWIEALRIDTATTVLGLRINIWTSIIVLVGAIVAFVVVTRRRPGRDGVLVRPVVDPSADTPDLMDDLKDDAKDGSKDDAEKVSDAEAADAKVKDALAGDEPAEKAADVDEQPDTEDAPDGGADDEPPTDKPSRSAIS